MSAVDNRTAAEMNEPDSGTKSETWRPRRSGNEPGEAADKMQTT